MYNPFYNLKRNPFGETPDTRFFFRGESHITALDQLLRAITSGKGFTLFTGPVGVGKTIISRLLLKFLQSRMPTALILNPTLNVEELTKGIREEFGIEPPSTSGYKAEYDCISSYLMKVASTGKRSVLIVDEAQRLTEDGLESIRLLSNLETEERKLLQIILIGQPELRLKLEDFNLRQLNQRISTRIDLAPLKTAEIEFYIKHRIELAGGANFVRFDERACQKIGKDSDGIPRLINALCERCLVIGSERKMRLIDSDIVDEALQTQRTSDRRWFSWFQGTESS